MYERVQIGGLILNFKTYYITRRFPEQEIWMSFILLLRILPVIIYIHRFAFEIKAVFIRDFPTQFVIIAASFLITLRSITPFNKRYHLLRGTRDTQLLESNI
ncbi:hypothetical protein D1159_18045 [Pseudoflavonifractor sp. 524-17]|nr:hypothetical protein [Pseudoflavonifractor sp. 524-17]